MENTVAFLQDIPGFLSDTMTAQPVMGADGLQVVENGMPLFGEATVYGAGAVTIVGCLAWGLGYFGMPQVLVRFMSARHSDDIKKSRIIATVWVVVSLASAVCIGLVGRAALPTEFLTASAAESIFVVLAQIMLPSFVCGLVVSGIFAATMSSSSSYLLIAGSAISQNLYGVSSIEATDAQAMFVSRVALTVILIFGIIIARPEFFDLPSCFIRMGWFSARASARSCYFRCIGVARIGRALSRACLRARQPLSCGTFG